MEVTREHFRGMILYDFKCGLSQQQCIDRLHSAFGNQAPGKTTVYEWFADLKRGRSTLTDEVREGRPKSVVPEKIEAVRKLIYENPQITYRQIKAALGISVTSIHTILQDHLGLKKERDQRTKIKLAAKSKKSKQKAKTKVEKYTEHCEDIENPSIV